MPVTRRPSGFPVWLLQKSGASVGAFSHQGRVWLAVCCLLVSLAVLGCQPAPQIPETRLPDQQPSGASPDPSRPDTPPSQASRERKLGVLMPLSGPGSKAGTRAQRGIEVALATLQQRDPDFAFSLVIRDTGETSATAGEALRALASDPSILGVIGPLFSQMATDLAPLTEQLALPMISPYARDSSLLTLSSQTFRNTLTDALQGRFLAEYATNVLKLKRFAILFPEDPYGTALKDHFRAAIQRHQGTIVATVGYSPKGTNLPQAVGRLKGARFEALFLPEYADRVGLVTAQLTAQNISGVRLLGTDGWNDPALVAKKTRAIEGAVFVDGFFAGAPSQTVKTFVEEFRARYRETPDLLVAQTYDTVLMCAQALKEGARTRGEFRDRLLQVRDFPGVSGLTTMGANRDADKIPYLLAVQRGRIVQLNAPPAKAR